MTSSKPPLKIDICLAKILNISANFLKPLALKIFNDFYCLYILYNHKLMSNF